ncbi:hypothetical protein Tco_0367555 [Tanacetum coccineum]
MLRPKSAKTLRHKEVNERWGNVLVENAKFPEAIENKSLEPRAMETLSLKLQELVTPLCGSGHEAWITVSNHIADRDPRFASNFYLEVTSDALGTKRLDMSTAYHPQDRRAKARGPINCSRI